MENIEGKVAEILSDEKFYDPSANLETDFLFLGVKVLEFKFCCLYQQLKANEESVLSICNQLHGLQISVISIAL